NAFLHRWLARRDPPTAARLAPADRQRLIRALELALGSPETWGERLGRRGTWRQAEERYPRLKVGLALDRERLGQRLDARVERFFSAGLVAEVRALLAQGVPRSANAFKGIGYREVLAALGAGSDPEASRDAVQRSTRRYAKRQRTWFRHEPDVDWLDASLEPERLVERVLELWRSNDREPA
ncbi:MAG TPA: tRNA dimethylallyltransferase, partial [Candidatus Polarisedimenticolaceae bacterium]|nr:tRNA dimethylallyltransferase [Candidatus Polarisedimenticolaceae bacterium]